MATAFGAKTVDSWPYFQQVGLIGRFGKLPGELSLCKMLQRKERGCKDRLSTIADMNHHARDALAVVAYYGTEGAKRC